MVTGVTAHSPRPAGGVPAARRRPGGARPRLRLAAMARRAAVAAVVLLAAYLALTAAQVWQAARVDGTRPAQAIVVLGAAQYDGRPSPALRQRLDHAADLYHVRLAPVVVVTGGSRPGDRFSEATASAGYLAVRGVPDAAIRREVHGRTTWEQLAASARFLRDEGITDVVLVSHAWHSRRVRLIADEVGLDASVSPTGRDRLYALASLRSAAREVVAVAAGRVLGFRRLTNLVAGPGHPAAAGPPGAGVG